MFQVSFKKPIPTKQLTSTFFKEKIQQVVNFLKNMDHNSIFLAKKAWQDAEAILIGAGAGMGVDSGLPDFRGNSGFWKAYPPLEKLGIQFHEIANPQWFTDDPNLAWGFYGHRLDLYQKTKPHHGFEILLEKHTRQEIPMFIFTSNVDGHFQKAGFKEDQIVECHGSIRHLQCTKACGQKIWRIDSNYKLDIDQDTLRASDPLPSCPSCYSVARPNILMFSDWEWVSTRTDEQNRQMNSWLNEIGNTGLCVIELGAGPSIPSVRINCEKAWQSTGGTFLRINPRDYDVSKGALSLDLRAEEALRAIRGNRTS